MSLSKCLAVRKEWRRDGSCARNGGKVVFQLSKSPLGNFDRNDKYFLLIFESYFSFQSNVVLIFETFTAFPRVFFFRLL